MMRLIDADKLLEDVRQQIDFLCSFEIDELVECGRIIHNGIIQEIEKMPTIDAEPVRRGKWVINECLGVKDMICPDCGAMYDYNEGLDEDWKYCPNCGAKMDGEGAET